MALNIKDAATESLATEVARQAGESKTTAVRVALSERKARLDAARVSTARQDHLRRFLQTEVWALTAPHGPNEPIPQAEQDELLGYGPGGV